jgi:serine/threonine protein kinase
MTGKQILNYKITREIGSGGMATVYEAMHIKFDTKIEDFYEKKNHHTIVIIYC